MPKNMGKKLIPPLRGSHSLVINSGILKTCPNWHQTIPQARGKKFNPQFLQQHYQQRVQTRKSLISLQFEFMVWRILGTRFNSNSWFAEPWIHNPGYIGPWVHNLGYTT